MTKVHCNVTNCSYNNERVCYAERVAIGGQGAKEEESTCCGTFLSQDVYSNLAEHTQYKSPCGYVSCSVATCTYHGDHKCTLNRIEVDGESPASVYIETCCSSFKPQ